MNENPHWPQHEINTALRKKWVEGLGKGEKQKHKTLHKRSVARYRKLLELYQEANPDFDAEKFYREETKNSDRSGHRKRKGGSGTSRRKKDEDFVFIDYGDDDGMNTTPHTSKHTSSTHLQNPILTFSIPHS